MCVNGFDELPQTHNFFGVESLSRTFLINTRASVIDYREGSKCSLKINNTSSWSAPDRLKTYRCTTSALRLFRNICHWSATTLQRLPRQPHDCYGLYTREACKCTTEAGRR